ncbi:MAG TPA: cysteine hydrolase family protein [Bacillales bacterium]|nr:cysteine hydrolase family protein [Bacillales bacterium]
MPDRKEINLIVKGEDDPMNRNTALLIIDVQNEMFLPEGPVYRAEQLIENLQSLIKKARAADVPVVYVQHNDDYLVNGTHNWEINPSISPAEGDLVIQKFTPDSFHETNLHEALKDKGIENLVIAGIQTECCVDTTCRRGFSLGYKQTLVSDAHSTWDSEDIKADQIINHHNRALSWFADRKETKEIAF